MPGAGSLDQRVLRVGRRPAGRDPAVGDNYPPGPAGHGGGRQGTAGVLRRRAQPAVGGGHHVCADSRRVCVLGHGAGRVQPQGRGAVNRPVLDLSDMRPQTCRGEGQAKLNVTSELQMFGLIVTAEPYFAVCVPSDLVIIENEIRKGTKGRIAIIDTKNELDKGSVGGAMRCDGEIER